MRFFKCGVWVSFFLSCILLFSLGVNAKEKVDAALVCDNADFMAKEINKIFSAMPGKVDSDALKIAELLVFYRHRNYRPLWCGSTDVYSHAENWISMLDVVEQQGIIVNVQYRNQLLQQLERRKLNSHDFRQLAELELMLTESFFQLARSVGQGQFDPATLGVKWGIPLPIIDPAELLEQAAVSGQFSRAIVELIPDHTDYKMLGKSLIHYRDIQQRGGWPIFHVGGSLLQLGDYGDEVLLLRKILWAMGDLRFGDTQNTQYDEALAYAVKRFQQRHGIEGDGIVGPETRAELMVPIEQRIETILLNLGRWRWMPRDLGDRYIKINSAAFELEVREGGHVPLKMRVIAGQIDHQTPVFMEKVRYLVANPYWNVPNSLARRKLLPRQISDPDYFQRKGIKVLSDWQENADELEPGDINWKRYLNRRYLPYRLRQDPGPKNALGRIKFMLPNRYNVYLHDTPDQHLFKESVRAFSSGCVRLEKPIELADYLMRTPDEPFKLSVEETIKQGETATISLPETIPAYIVYQTAWVDDGGVLQFRDDIYGRDHRLTMALKKQSLASSNVASAMASIYK